MKVKSILSLAADKSVVYWDFYQGLATDCITVKKGEGKVGSIPTQSQLLKKISNDLLLVSHTSILFLNKHLHVKIASLINHLAHLW